MRAKKNFLAVLILSLMTFLVLTYQGINVLSENEDFQKTFGPKYSSLILGTSRAARLSDSLMYHILNEERVIFNPILNYAFNLKTSPFGPVYLESIKRKLNPNQDKGQNIFLICVDPFNVSAKSKYQDNPELLREKNSHVSFQTDQLFAKIKYFYKYYDKPYYTLLIPKKKKVEIKDSVFLKQHLKTKIENYKKTYVDGHSISELRYSSLETLIKEVSNIGRAYLIRLPVTSEMIELEYEYSPLFDSKLATTSKNFNASIIDFRFVADNFSYSDANHLFQEDAKQVSSIIADIVRLDIENLIQHDGNLLNGYLLNDQAKYRHLMQD